ncbi:MAG TPA: hypothetical protein VFO35_04110 [Steroidobacteraceae bacterium]|nr:hypothetical protein [Steroidobacteraceae bacterium]
MLCDMHIHELLGSPPYVDARRLERHGYRSFSQNDEDGILQEIFRRIGPQTLTFAEFGVGNGLQNNTRLLLYQGWRGLWIEGDPDSCAKVRRSFEAELLSGQLQLLERFVTRENIQDLIESARLGEIDLLSIDIDGNDYWIWEAIQLRPRVVVIEYNAKFHPPTRWIMEYNAGHRWDASDYQGAALQSLADLASQKGYALVGCSLAGVNAFFVRAELTKDHFPPSDPALLYNPPRYYLKHFLSSGHPARSFGPYRSQ